MCDGEKTKWLATSHADVVSQRFVFILTAILRLDMTTSDREGTWLQSTRIRISNLYIYTDPSIFYSGHPWDMNKCSGVNLYYKAYIGTF